MHAIEVLQLLMCSCLTVFLCRMIYYIEKKKVRAQLLAKRINARSCVKSPACCSQSLLTAHTFYDYPYCCLTANSNLSAVSDCGIVCDQCTSNVWSDEVYHSMEAMRRKTKHLFDESTQCTQPTKTSLSKISFMQEPEFACETLSMTFVANQLMKTQNTSRPTTGLSLRKSVYSINKSAGLSSSSNKNTVTIPALPPKPYVNETVVVSATLPQASKLTPALEFDIDDELDIIPNPTSGPSYEYIDYVDRDDDGAMTAIDFTVPYEMFPFERKLFSAMF